MRRFIVPVVLLAACAAFAGDAGRPAAAAEGNAALQAGWRGNWTGLYPDASPVTEWRRLPSGAAAGLWPLLGALAVGSVIGLFYYLRIVIAIFSSADPAPLADRSVPLAGGVLLSVLTLLLIWLGVYPAPILRVIEAAAERF